MNGTLIDHGITVFVFYEGIWDKRLKYLAELPKGKTVGWFQSSDIFKVKEVLGDTMCILAGMPVSMLSGGTVEQVRERTKNEILLNLFGYTRGLHNNYMRVRSSCLSANLGDCSMKIKSGKNVFNALRETSIK